MSLSFKYTPHPGSNRPSQSEDTQEAPSVDDIMMDLEGQLARMGQAGSPCAELQLHCLRNQDHAVPLARLRCKAGWLWCLMLARCR